MTKPMSPLRQRMLDDMAFRNMSSNTMKVYTYAVGNFAKYHRQSPDKLGACKTRSRSKRIWRDSSLVLVGDRPQHGRQREHDKEVGNRRSYRCPSASGHRPSLFFYGMQLREAGHEQTSE